MPYEPIERERPNKSNFRRLGFSQGWYCGVPIYARDHGEEEGMEACGRNWFYDILLSLVTWVNLNIRGDEGFIFKILVHCDCDEDCPQNTKCVNQVCKLEKYDKG